MKDGASNRAAHRTKRRWESETRKIQGILDAHLSEPIGFHRCGISCKNELWKFLFYAKKSEIRTALSSRPRNKLCGPSCSAFTGMPRSRTESQQVAASRSNKFMNFSRAEAQSTRRRNRMCRHSPRSLRRCAQQVRTSPKEENVAT